MVINSFSFLCKNPTPYTYQLPVQTMGVGVKKTQQGREGSPGHARCISLTILGATNAAARVKIEIEVLEEIH